ncbi:MAG: prepilin-type N-terminal cleavage/methylation domain-containing protein [Deltaproteobacteria bacterium]|nr:prepilin-type N-terminal cleavage/methylation domain-containing protein [Deltaproteobacteria bacterium]
MRTSTAGTISSRIGDCRARDRRGFTLIELSVVLFVLGLVFWLAMPHLAGVGEPDRGSVFRELAAGSEEAFDLSLFEKREARLVLDPKAGTYLFQTADGRSFTPSAKPLGSRLTITGIRIENEDRPLDLVTEIRYLPGGKVPAARIFFRDKEAGGDASDWTLRINPFDGSMEVLEGTVVKDA